MSTSIDPLSVPESFAVVAPPEERADLGDENPRPAAPADPDPKNAGAGVLDVLLVAGWMGLAFGLVEAGYFAFVRFALGGVTPGGVRLLWMCPAMQAVTFLALAAPFGLLVAATRKPVSFATLLCWTAFLGATSLAFLVPGVHTAARLLVAAGIAVQAWRFGGARGPEILRFCRRTFAGLLLIALAVWAAVEGSHSIAARRGIATLPAPQKRAPNVLLVVLDTVSAEAVGAVAAEASGESSADTPNLARLASEGAVFTQAIAPAPWTLPSHASMFTGRHPYELSCRWFTALDDTFPTVAEQMRRSGYATAGFVANTRFCRAETGLARGFIHYDDFSITPARFLLSTELGRRAADVRWIFFDADQVDRKSADDVAQAFLRWLDGPGADANRPFFAFLNLFDAHDPYVPPPSFGSAPCDTEAHRDVIRDWWYLEKSKLSDQEVRFARTNYHDCISYLDDRLGELFRQLARRGLLDDTLVIVTSDHGEHFGDHGLFGHGNSLYQPAIHVPLILRWPEQIPAGVRCDAPVGLRALPATIVELAGITDHRARGGEPAFPGQSLSQFWIDRGSPSDPPPDVVISSIETPPQFPPCHGRSPVFRGSMKSAIAGHFKYIRAGDHEELYDVRQDPAELHNLAGQDRFASQLERLRHALPGGTSPRPAP